MNLNVECCKTCKHENVGYCDWLKNKLTDCDLDENFVCDFYLRKTSGSYRRKRAKYNKRTMKHPIPKECVPARCVDGSCPVALAKEHGYDVVGIPYDFDCKDCSENITYCEECKYFKECLIMKGENK